MTPTDLALYNHPAFREANRWVTIAIQILMKDLEMTEEQACNWIRAWGTVADGD